MPKWKVKLVKGTFGCEDIKVVWLERKKKWKNRFFFFFFLIEKKNKEIENIVCVNVSYCPY